jgi:Fe-S cluster assembly protein SufB/Fe-S cluster assembly protein SufD
MSQLSLSAINASHIEELSTSKKEPSWLKEYRKNSLSIYQEMPIEVSPLYSKYTDVNKMDPKQVSLSLIRWILNKYRFP